MPSKSKTKGNAGEHALIKILKEHLGGSWTRVPNSGAALGGKNHYRAAALSATQVKIFKGDIIPPDNLPHIVIESKSYADFPYNQLIHGNSVALLDGWIKQQLDIIEEGDFWLVAFKTNRNPWTAVFAEEHFSKFTLKTFTRYVTKEGLACYLTELESFLAANARQVLRISGDPGVVGVADPIT